MKKRFYYFLLFLIAFVFHSYAQVKQIKEFDNINKGDERINCFFQDQQRLIWVGTTKGLFSYNGYSLDKNIIQESEDFTNLAINCSLKLDSDHFYLGCSNGIILFNIKKNTYTLLPSTSSHDVRSIIWSDKHTIMAGTMCGLIIYDIKTNKTKIVDEKIVPHWPVYSLIKKDNKSVYISSYKGVYILNKLTNKTTFIPLAQTSKKKLLILSMVKDIYNNCIWIGTEGELFKYCLETKSIELLPLFSNNSIKSMITDNSGQLWIGTDNGLYLYNHKSKSHEYFVHSIRDNKSLINNIVWAVFEDREKNIWLGTDCGISLYKNNNTFQIHRWDEITGSDEGNRLTCIYKDSRNSYWFGGTNGLVRYDSKKQKAVWYKMRGNYRHISHNHIRSIYEGIKNDLWVATDGGINNFNYQTERFTHYSIMDKTTARNANWAYQIFDDNQNRLWVATYMSGIFMVDKQKLLKSKDEIYLADKNYYMNKSKDGLLGNGVLLAFKDKQQNPVLIMGKDGINRINIKKNKVERIPYTPKSTIICALLDKEGFLWLGMRGTIDRLNIETGEIKSINNSLLQDMDISSCTEENNHIWITATEGVYVIDKQSLLVKHVDLGDQRFFCSFYDVTTGTMIMGGIDLYVEFSPKQLLKRATNSINAVLTSIYVNDERINTGKSYDGNVILSNNIGYTKEILLNDNQNNLVFEYSDLLYGQAIKSHYVYKLEGVDNEWHNMNASLNKISYSNLSPGNYTFQIQKVDDNGINYPSMELAIIIRHPWYSTPFADIIYLTLFIGLLLWTINYFRVKNRLKIERIQKEKTLELSNLKMDFLTNISHELKTPLSLIISPISKLLDEAKNAQIKSQLRLIYKNAIRLNALVHQMIDFKDIDPLQSEIILSKLDIVEYIKSVLELNKEAFESKNIILEFSSDINQLYMNVDVLKIESVINNLISNACKFSKQNGLIKVDLALYKDENSVQQFQITVSDNGIGIPGRDLPYVFKRFYQSKENLNMNSEGSGIGLSIVKNYVELHHGQVKISSEEEKGTTVCVTIPVIDGDQNSLREETVIGRTSNDIQTHKILIVEDNVEIARFISENLRTSAYQIVHNGKMGIEMALKYQPDLIIADVMMPVMDGIEMSRLLKQNIATATIPIIMLTAKDDKRTEAQAFELGVEAFISKPFDIKQLNTRIEQLIKSKKQLVNKLRQATILEDKQVDIQSQDEKFIMKITQVIEERLSDSDLNVQSLAEYTGYSPKQVYRKIKLLTGHTAVDYIKFIRLKKAAILLSQRKFTIAEVMYMVGFSNHSYFSKCFTEKYGKTPKQFMESAPSSILN